MEQNKFNKKINILMIGSNLNVKGGMTTIVEAFLNKSFNDININYVSTHIEKNILYKVTFFIISIFKIIYKLIFKDISIIHMHLSEKGSFFRKYIIFIISKVFNKDIIVHMHGAEFKEFYFNSPKVVKNMIKFLLKKSNRVLVLGDSWNKFVKEIDKSINTCIFRNSVKYPIEKAQYNGKSVNILFLAVLIERKGIFDLIEAADKLIQDEDIQKYNLKFTIAGSGIEEEKVKKKVIDKGLDNLFEFKGWVNGEEKRNLLIDSQVFVLPSYNEGLPVAILEAMSYGVPIVSTSVGSIEDAVIHNYNGFILEPGDIENLKACIKECIIDKEKWSLFSINGKKSIRENYNEEDYFIEIENLYKDLYCRS